MALCSSPEKRELELEDLCCILEEHREKKKKKKQELKLGCDFEETVWKWRGWRWKLAICVVVWFVRLVNNFWAGKCLLVQRTCSVLDK